jgi:hypothetical protein
MEHLIQGYFCGDINDLKKVARWGTFGKSGKEPLKYVKLIDCSTEHLEAILQQPYIQDNSSMVGMIEIINAIIADRK